MGWGRAKWVEGRRAGGVVFRARFQGSQTTPSVMERLKMSQMGVAISGVDSLINLGGKSSDPGNILFTIRFRC